MKILFCLLLSAIQVYTKDIPSPIVNTPQGQIEGFVAKSVSDRQFYSFEGVPYANPPIGKHRFKAPIPPKHWDGIWIARTITRCLQYNHFTPPGQEMVVGDEDCLHLNIYTSNLNQSANLDVLVYIHGGAFMFNYGGMQGPDLVLDHDIVYVNLNYRLGPLGFLSTEDEVVPGNNGLKDQLLALKWIKENIQYFGGNPNSITITGMSAGGASVELHYLMPKSKGLFHKGISQSGTVLCPWVLVENSLEKAKIVADYVGCPTDNSKKMIKCLRRRPAKQIVDAVQVFQPWLYNPFSPFAAVVDIWASDPVLPDHPYRLLKTGKIQDLPWISSYVSSEGLYPVSDFYDDQRLREIDTKWNELMPFILDYNFTVDPALLEDVGHKIRYEYFGDKSVSKATFNNLIRVVSDRLFDAYIEKATRLHAANVKSPIYSYYFNYRGAFSASDFRTGTNINFGASHADDTSYVYKTHINTRSTDNDIRMSNLLIEMFLSFMRTGTPKVPVKWEPISKNLNDYWMELQIDGPDKMQMGSKVFLGNRPFWDSLPLHENEEPMSIKDEL